MPAQRAALAAVAIMRQTDRFVPRATAEQYDVVELLTVCKRPVADELFDSLRGGEDTAHGLTNS